MSQEEKRVMNPEHLEWAEFRDQFLYNLAIAKDTLEKLNIKNLQNLFNKTRLVSLATFGAFPDIDSSGTFRYFLDNGCYSDWQILAKYFPEVSAESLCNPKNKGPARVIPFPRKFIKAAPKSAKSAKSNSKAQVIPLPRRDKKGSYWYNNKYKF